MNLKKTLKSALCLCLTLILFTALKTAYAADPTVSSFVPDANLRAVLSTELAKLPDATWKANPAVAKADFANKDSAGWKTKAKVSAALMKLTGSIKISNANITNLTGLNYMKKVTTIDISGCTGLDAVANSAFDGCITLQKVVLPKQIEDIGSRAFYACRKLTSINFPEALLYIDDSAFAGCTALAEINLSGAKLLEEISDSAFENCSSVTKVTLPASLISIGSAAFADCKKLVEVNFASLKKLEYLYSEAFRNCVSLKSAMLEGTKLTSIDDSAFINCTALTGISIPTTLLDIESQAFYGCKVLGSGKTLRFNTKLNSIGDEAFAGTPLKGIVTPPNLTSLSPGAFANCTALEAIDFTKSTKLTNISLETFMGCTKLVTVGLPSSIFVIGRSAFEGCTALTKIVIPAKVTKVEVGAFLNASYLSNVTMPKTADVEANAFMDTSLDKGGILTLTGGSAKMSATVTALVTELQDMGTVIVNK